MKSIKSLLTVISVAVSAPLALQAQRTAEVHGKYTYILTADDNVTIKEAKIKSIEEARIEALRTEFGTMVVSDFINSERADNDDIRSYYIMDSSSSVKGEWLGDTRNPEVNIEVIDGEIYFKAEVWGTAREIKRATTDIKWEIQREAGGRKVEAESFDNGERFFIKFQSPADGYLAIYLIDGDNGTACLLPYRKNYGGRFQVKGGKEYTLFDKTEDPSATYYKFSTDRLNEHNQLVLIYSPNPFTKCMDTSGDKSRPNFLEQKDFAKWLLKSQRADKDMVVNRKWISIKGTE